LNIREITKLSPNYFEINREERNYAAILFAALCLPGNAERFLKYCGFNESIGPEFGIYFEYSYLRDLWFKINNEDLKFDILQQMLKIENISNILNKPIKEINRYFGVSGKPSSKFLQFPGKWSIRKFNNNFPDNDDFLKICKFKWSFNIKPDIVIHLDKNRPICIEAKYESIEGSYPSSNVDKSIFNDRGISYVGQMELQKYMMEELLGFNADFMFLVFKKEKSKTHKVISWGEAFSSVDIKKLPDFAKHMAKNISQ